jgi:hypothetical protein
MGTYRTTVLVVALLALTTMALAQQAPVIRPQVKFEDPLTAKTLQLSPLQLSQQFQGVLAAKGIKGKQAEQASDKFRSLPEGLQSSLLLTLDESLAKKHQYEALSISRLDPAIIARVEMLRIFVISGFWPEQGAPGNWSYVLGSGFNDDCTVYFDGSPVESHYLGEAIEFFPNSMAFEVPAGASRGQEHDVFVRNTATNNDTATVKYEIVAPRSYRSYHGWSFSNFSRGSIDWDLYADYFGRLNVEYADGTHRPAAQTWYDNSYTRAGAGGNCYGMSVSSLRVKNREFDHMTHANYFQNAPTAEPWVWLYDWNDTTRRTVQQQQGAWYTQEILDLHNDYWNNQDPRDVFTRCQNFIGEITNRPILVYWGQNAGGNWWGHVVCPYRTEVDGNARRMIVYDNNNPYRENETGSVDPDVATVDWAANTFSRGSATKAQLYTYEECTPANPHLPGAEYGGPGSNSVVAVFSANADVQQITDENGRTFFNADGSLNTNPGTRIPNASIVPPLVQLQPRVIRQPRIGQLQLPQLQLERPDDAPLIFVFGEAGGKDLRFNLAGQGAKQMQLFAPGRIFSVEASGIGEIRVNDLLLPAVQIPNPQAVSPGLVEYIRSTPGGDRVFELSNIRNLGAQPLELLPNPNGTEVEVNGPPALQFDLEVLGPVGQGMQGASFGNIALQAGAKANLRPQNWRALQASGLRLQMRNLQNDAVINQQTLQRLR